MRNLHPLLAPLVAVLWVSCFISFAWASTPLFSPKRSTAYADGALDESLLTIMNPRCDLELVGKRFASGDTVSASWRILNPAPTRVMVEIKIWFTAPGQAPYSISRNSDAGQPVVLPASLDEETGMTELFAVENDTTRGIYEISCRLIDPITGSTYSEDLNDFQVY